MRAFVAAAVVFVGGFAIMVLEIIGARFLAKDFGSSFYVWVSQIGVVLTALAVGYFLGGWLADKFLRFSLLAFLLVPAGALTMLVPEFAPRLINAIVLRHPAERAVPLLWQKLDPAIGSCLVFLLPCVMLAALSPFMTRMMSRQIGRVGRTSGLVFAISTAGSIAGVFISGYVLIDHMNLSRIFNLTGALTIGLGLVCWLADRWFRGNTPSKGGEHPCEA
jgi:MFS family permease